MIKTIIPGRFQAPTDLYVDNMSKYSSPSSISLVSGSQATVCVLLMLLAEGVCITMMS